MDRRMVFTLRSDLNSQLEENNALFEEIPQEDFAAMQRRWCAAYDRGAFWVNCRFGLISI